MNGKREIADYYSGGYYMSHNQLYKVFPNFALEEIKNPELRKRLQYELNLFQQCNYYVCNQDRIIPDSLYFKALKINPLYHKTQTAKEPYSEEYI